VEEVAIWRDADSPGEAFAARLFGALVDRHGADWAKGRVQVWVAEDGSKDAAAMAAEGTL
jgi:hypothetical protein